MGFLAGKRILITGLLSNRSIAYGIAKAMHREGAELAFTYQNDRFKDRVAKLAADFGSSLIYPLDVQDDAQITGRVTVGHLAAVRFGGVGFLLVEFAVDRGVARRPAIGVLRSRPDLVAQQHDPLHRLRRQDPGLVQA